MRTIVTTLTIGSSVRVLKGARQSRASTERPVR